MKKDNEFYLMEETYLKLGYDYSGIMVAGNDRFYLRCKRNTEGKKGFLKCEWVIMKKTGIELKDSKTIGSMLKDMKKS